MNRLLCIMSDSDLEPILKKSNDQFSANMLQEVVKSQGDQSCVLSAFSVLSPLAQLALASVGDSHDEILSTIGFPNDNVTKLVFSDMNTRLRSVKVKGVDLELANKVYIRDDYSLNDQFAALSKKIFHSEVENIDFNQNVKAAAEINTWVEDHTHQHIKNLVNATSIDYDTAAILVNAIYFKGMWIKPFNKYLTENRYFYVTKQLTKRLPMMHQSETFNYADSKEFDAQFLEMEYEDSVTSLVVALPKKIEGVNNLIEKMKDPSVLNKARNQMHPAGVRVFLPKFKIETTTNLKGVLEKMNITKLYKKDLCISDATQKVFIEVNEKGVEAAVSNQFTGLIPLSRSIYLPGLEFKADHPFLFFIIERNNILFSGVYRS